MIVAIVIIAGAGVGAYIVLSGDNNSDNDSGYTPPKNPVALGGPGLSVGESLTYEFHGSMSMGNTHINDAIAGTITISYAQNSARDYKLTVSVSVAYNVMGYRDSITETQTFVVDGLDMREYDTGTIDLEDLKDEYGYSAEDIRKIQSFIDNFSSEAVTLSTVDGNIGVEKRTYSYGWADLMSLVPEMGGMEDLLTSLDMNFVFWFGKDVLYKATFDMDIGGISEFMAGAGADATAKFTGTLELKNHTPA